MWADCSGIANSKYDESFSSACQDIFSVLSKTHFCLTVYSLCIDIDKWMLGYKIYFQYEKIYIQYKEKMNLSTKQIYNKNLHFGL